MSGWRSSAALTHVQWSYLVVSDQWWKRKDKKSYKPQSPNEEGITSIFSFDRFCKCPALEFFSYCNNSSYFGGEKKTSSSNQTPWRTFWVSFVFARSKRHSCGALPRSHTCTFPLSFSSLQQLLLRLGGLQEPLRVSLLPSAACLLPCLQPVPSSGQGEEAVASLHCTLMYVCMYVLI